MPRPTETTRPPSAPALRLSPDHDEFDALAELFLGGDPAEPTTVPHARALAHAQAADPAAAPTPDLHNHAPAPRPDLELLILGHLPVRASPWASQYARLAAERLGAPVALARAVGGELALEVFGLTGDARQQPLRAEFGPAVAAAAAAAKHWILQFDEVTEPQVVADPRIGSLTLVSGANETAVVAAYRTLKSLAPNEDESPADAGDDAPGGPRLRIAVMGADGKAAADAASKLQQAARVFLSRPVGFAGAIARIGPTGAATLYRGSAPATGAALIDALVDAAAPAHSVREDPAPARIQPHTPAFNAPAPAEGAPPAERSKSDSLAGRLISAGLTPLKPRCPDDPATELAADASGRLHVLRDADGADGYQRLIGALAWATRHRDLIALAAGPQAPIDPAASVVGHVFTREPKALLHVAHAEVKLHLFAPANVGAGEGWCCADLN